MAKDPNEIGALWLKETKEGKKYFSGTVNGESIVIFRNTFKREGEKSPDYRILKSTKQEDSAPRNEAPSETPAPSTNQQEFVRDPNTITNNLPF